MNSLASLEDAAPVAGATSLAQALIESLDGQVALLDKAGTGTVDVHRRDIMRKLGMHSAVDLTRYAISVGLVSG